LTKTKNPRGERATRRRDDKNSTYEEGEASYTDIRDGEEKTARLTEVQMGKDAKPTRRSTKPIEDT
jgi:hypothetical protein